MKKIFTLFFAFSMFAVAQAQPGTRDNRDNRQPMPPVAQQDRGNGYGKDVVVYNDFGKDNRYDDRVSMDRRKDMEIARVNRTYDIKIQQVRNNFFMGRFEKQRQIRFLEQQRQQDLRTIMMKYKRNGGRYDDGRGYNDRDNSRNHY